MNNVVSLLDRMERWTSAYESPDGSIVIKASSHGRFSFYVRGQKTEVTHLDFVESVNMLSRLSDGMSNALEMT